MNKKRSVWRLIWVWLASAVFIVFISGCGSLQPAPAGGEQKGFDWTIIIFLVLMFVLVYFLIIRPQRKKQKDQQEMMSELKKGDKVITAGGIYGQVESLSEDSVVLKVESGSTIRVSRGSISVRRKT